MNDKTVQPIPKNDDPEDVLRSVLPELRRPLNGIDGWINILIRNRQEENFEGLQRINQWNKMAIRVLDLLEEYLESRSTRE
jgi:hypothetical protein